MDREAKTRVEFMSMLYKLGTSEALRRFLDAASICVKFHRGNTLKSTSPFDRVTADGQNSQLRFSAKPRKLLGRRAKCKTGQAWACQ